MSELISGKEALNYAFDGVDVEYQVKGDFNWCNFNDESWTIDELKSKGFIFRLKPKTITLNGIEVPSPFEPKEDYVVFILDDSKTSGYRRYSYEVDGDSNSSFYGLWRTEDEIEQVVAALRKIFVINNH